MSKNTADKVLNSLIAWTEERIKSDSFATDWYGHMYAGYIKALEDVLEMIEEFKKK